MGIFFGDFLYPKEHQCQISAWYYFFGGFFHSTPGLVLVKKLKYTFRAKLMGVSQAA